MSRGPEEDLFANLELSGGAEAGVAALEKRKRKPGPYRGLNRSEGHMAFVRQCRKIKTAQAGDGSKVMRKIWNGAKILRGGDKWVERRRRKRATTRKGYARGIGKGGLDKWTLSGFVRTAWKDLGHNNHWQGIDGSHNTLEVISGVACASMAKRNKMVADFVQQAGGGEYVVIGRYYDATPMRLSFSNPTIREQLEPLAR